MKLPGRNKVMQFLFILVCSIDANAQTTIKGIITNSNRDPQAAATIHVKETNLGTYADSAGRFQLIISGKGKRKLEISSVGYSTRVMEIVLNDSIVQLEVEFESETKTLGDVV